MVAVTRAVERGRSGPRGSDQTDFTQRRSVRARLDTSPDGTSRRLQQKPMTHPLLLWILPIAISVLAAAIDFRTGRIPNWLTLPAMVVALAEGTVLHRGAGFLQAALGLLLCGAVPWLLHRLSGGQAIGGGDVKLFATLGAFGGLTLGLEIEFSSFALLAVFALVQLAFRGQLLTVLGNVGRILVRPFRRTGESVPLSPASLTEMRMGPAIAVAVLAVALIEWLPWLA